ncbi:hypothetical protein [Streptomyces sp. BA2]|uniref:hypothetical protein n=1 Tax=Streptomyces sp. BA2 TaxID=436595 RepID=UPI0013238D03|nr:hypothetical protein [Streptomyces sp. BA2]MWA12247.1 hypothetical protein [Streptomyces sp. BA2]
MTPLILAAEQQSSASFTAAAFVAACALVFTVASFWWINAHQGDLKAWKPHSFAACVTSSMARIRFPLVLYNTGAKPIVVLDVRLRFPDEPRPELVLPWTSTRDRLRPEKEDALRLPACFAVAGRTAEQLFIEFGAPYPTFVPEARDYKVVIEAKLGHRKLRHRVLRRRVEWESLVVFTLCVAQIAYPKSYIAYSNSPRDITEEDRRKAEAALGDLRTMLQVSLARRVPKPESE